MRRVLLQSSPFVRAARRVMKKNLEIGPTLEATIAALIEDPFQPVLKTHKLKGDLAGYDLRLIFEFVQHNGTEAILLQNIGTHDEVY